MPNLIVPKLKNVDDHYRISFDTLQNPDFNQEVEATIEKQDSEDLFGPTTSDNEETPDATYSPPKKKNKKVS